MCNSTSVLVVTAHRRDLAVKKRAANCVQQQSKRAAGVSVVGRSGTGWKPSQTPAASSNMDEELEKDKEALVAMA